MDGSSMESLSSPFQTLRTFFPSKPVLCTTTEAAPVATATSATALPTPSALVAPPNANAKREEVGQSGMNAHQSQRGPGDAGMSKKTYAVEKRTDKKETPRGTLVPHPVQVRKAVAQSALRHRKGPPQRTDTITIQDVIQAAPENELMKLPKPPFREGEIGHSMVGRKTPAVRILTTESSIGHTEVENDEAVLLSKTKPPENGTTSTEPSMTDLQKWFPNSPAEIRCMIYAAMVNEPRLLLYSKCSMILSRNLYGCDLPELGMPERSMAVENSSLPPAALLNKESYEEVMRHIIRVPGAKKNNVLEFPWAYINPRFDVLCLRYGEVGISWPTAEQAPGIRTIALEIDSPWGGDEGFHVHQYPTLQGEMVIVDQIRKFPDLQEIIFVRSLKEMKSSPANGGGYYKFSKPKHGFSYYRVVKPEDKYPCYKIPPDIHRHACGFVGAINNEIEDALASLPPPWYARDRFPAPYQRPTEAVVSELEKAMTKINDRLYPGTKLPRMSAAYGKWLDEDGNWQKV